MAAASNSDQKSKIVHASNSHPKATSFSEIFGIVEKSTPTPGGVNPSNVSFSSEGVHLKAIGKNGKANALSGGHIACRDLTGYGRYQVLMKVPSDKQNYACSAMWLYRDNILSGDPNTFDEIDFEIGHTKETGTNVLLSSWVNGKIENRPDNLIPFSKCDPRTSTPYWYEINWSPGKVRFSISENLAPDYRTLWESDEKEANIPDTEMRLNIAHFFIGSMQETNTKFDQQDLIILEYKFIPMDEKAKPPERRDDYFNNFIKG